MTFDSPERLKEGIDELRQSYEQLRSHLKNRDDVSVDFIEETIYKQSEIIEKMGQSSEAREQLKTRAPDRWDERMDELRTLRDEAESLLQDRLRAVDSELESIDRNLEVMDRYKQDGENNYYLDEKI